MGVWEPTIVGADDGNCGWRIYLWRQRALVGWSIAGCSAQQLRTGSEWKRDDRCVKYVFCCHWSLLFIFFIWWRSFVRVHFSLCTSYQCRVCNIKCDDQTRWNGEVGWRWMASQLVFRLQCRVDSPSPRASNQTCNCSRLAAAGFLAHEVVDGNGILEHFSSLFAVPTLSQNDDHLDWGTCTNEGLDIKENLLKHVISISVHRF